MELTQEQIDRIAEAIAAGNKIDAIKRYRTATGLGLKESKEFIEKLTGELRAKNPELYPAKPVGKGCSVVSSAVLLGVGLCVTAVWWMFAAV